MSRCPARGGGRTTPSLVKPLQWLVVVVIFLFFLRVARAITVQASAPDVTRGRRAPRREPALRPRVHRARRAVRRARRAAEHLDIGRGLASDLVLDDAFVSSRHASVEYGARRPRARRPRLDQRHLREREEDRHTRRGSSRGDVVQIGSFVFEVVR